MIDKINDYSYKSFSKYTNPDHFLFKQKNVFFGYNGKGKSSLANGIVCEIKKDKTINDENIRFFSKDFLSIKLINDITSRIKGIKAIFGNKNVKNDEQIDELKSELVDPNPIKESKDNLKRKIDDTIKLITDNLKGKIKLRYLKIDNFENVDSLINTLESNYRKALSITTDDKLDKFNGNFDFDKVKTELNVLPILSISLNKDNIKTSLIIMNKAYSLEKIPSIELLDWIQNGLRLNKNETHCLFCGSPLLNIDKIREKYEKYISNEKQKDKKTLIDIHDELKSTLNNLDGFLKQAELYKSQNIDISSEVKEILSKKIELEKLINLIQTKLNDFENKLSLPFELTLTNGSIELQLAKINEKKSQAISSISREESKTNDLIKGLIAKTLLNNKQFNKDIKDYKIIINKLSVTEKNNEIINKKIKNLKNSISVFDSFAKYINSILLDLDIKFKLEIIDNDYRIVPLNEDSEIKIKDISEGERNLLSFLFFYYELFDNLDKTSFKSEIKYIIIDDPISSLDANNKYYLVSLIKSLLEDSQIQVFIFTHDWTSFCNILYGKNNLHKETSNIRAFEIKKDSESHSYLAFANPTISPYEHDFFEIIDMAELNSPDALNDSDIYHLPNCMRRVLEHFLEFKSAKHSPTDNNFEQIKTILYPNNDYSKKDITNLHSALTLINANSHEPARNATEVYNSLKYLVKAIESADVSHFNMIKNKRSTFKQNEQNNK